MTPPRLTVVYSDEQSARATLVAETLRNLGHEVSCFADPRALLSAPEPDAYVLGRSLADGSDGLELLEALRQAGRSAPIVILDERPTFDDMRRAIESGATDIVVRPTEEGELARALSRAGARRIPKARIDAAPKAHSYTRTYPSDPANVGRAAREISAFLVNEGVANAHRVRIASALAELVDNACRHAYPGGAGEIAVHAELQRTRVQLTVADKGRGFDVERDKLERIPPALPSARGRAPAALRSPDSGLGRVARLCESHTLTSGARGTRAELTFELTPVRFDEEAEHLAETDFLDPSRARSLIASLRKGQSDLSGIAPGMALTLGRILGGLDAEIRPPQ